MKMTMPSLIVASIYRIAGGMWNSPYVYLVGSATFKSNPRDIDILVITNSTRGGQLKKMYMDLTERFGERVKIATQYYGGCSDRVVGGWDIWVGVLSTQDLYNVPAVLRRTWRENYIAYRSPPLEHVMPPAEITLGHVLYGPYGVEFCKKHLAEGWLEEIVLDRESFVNRRVQLNDSQKEFLRQYCLKWALRNLEAVGAPPSIKASVVKELAFNGNS